MLLTRFWYVVLAASAAALLAAGLLAQTAFNRQHDSTLADQLSRDRREIELVLRTDARARLDAIAPIATHADVRALLSDSSPSVEAARRTQQSIARLSGQLGEMRADLLFLIHADGRFAPAAILPPGAGSLPSIMRAGLGQFPAVRRALAGYIRDDVWIYNRVVYRIAARPVIDSGRYVGAIVHGMRVDGNLAQRLGRMLDGAGVVFFRADEILAEHFPPGEANTVDPRSASPRDELAKKLPSLQGDSHLRAGESTDPVNVTDHHRAVLSLMTGSAGAAGVGYAIVRPVVHLASASGVFEVVTNDDVGRLPWATLISIFLAAVLIAMLVLWVERDRPLKRLRVAMGSVVEGRLERLSLADVGGTYRQLADQVNRAIDRTAEQAGQEGGRRKSANLDEILGPTPEAKTAAPFFSFGNAPSQPAPAQPPVASQRPRPPVAPSDAPATPATAQAPSAGPTGIADRPGKAVSPPTAPATSPARAISKPEIPAAVAPRAAPAAPGATVQGASGAGVNAAAAKHRAFDGDEEIATTVADIPEQLIAASSESDRDAEQKRFHDVYEKFCETRKECGEAVEGLTFDKFVRTLERNRDQILTKHPGSSVRFAVYVKEGKASLKATPVK